MKKKLTTLLIIVGLSGILYFGSQAIFGDDPCDRVEDGQITITGYDESGQSPSEYAAKIQRECDAKNHIANGNGTPTLTDSPNVKKVEKAKPKPKTQPVRSQPSKPSPAPTKIAVSSNILRLINEVRSRAGVPPLRESGVLNGTAAKSVQSMIDRQACSQGEWCDHGNWQQWYAMSGFTYFGEIIAACQTTDRQVVFDSWTNSPTHYARMVAPEYRYFGVATKYGPFKGDFSGGKTITCEYYVVHFGA